MGTEEVVKTQAHNPCLGEERWKAGGATDYYGGVNFNNTVAKNHNQPKSPEQGPDVQ